MGVKIKLETQFKSQETLVYGWHLLLLYPREVTNRSEWCTVCLFWDAWQREASKGVKSTFTKILGCKMREALAIAVICGKSLW